jgi:MFS family permease
VLGYRKGLALACLSFFLATFGAYCVPRTHLELFVVWLPLIGICSGVFGIFTMYLPPLFPTLLRTTGAGFSYNIGRLAAAAGTIIFGVIANKEMGDLRVPLMYSAFLFLPAMGVSLLLPDLRDE